MMETVEHCRFEILGKTQGTDAVFGILQTQGGGYNRFVTVVLCDGLNDHRRKERLSMVRSELNNNAMALLADKDPRVLRRHFDVSSADEFVCKISHAEYAVQSLQLTFDESRSPILQIACDNKASFWTVMRLLGTEREDMLSIAELDAFVDQEQAINGPIGDAHKLCDTINKMIAQAQKKKKRGHNREACDDVIAYGEDLLGKVIDATKVRLPDYNGHTHFISAMHTRDMQRLEEIKKLRREIKQANERGQRSRGLVERLAAAATRLLERLSARKVEIPSDPEGLKAEARSIRKRWQDMSGTRIEKLSFPESAVIINKVNEERPGETRLQCKVREGFHLMPSKYCLFEHEHTVAASDADYYRLYDADVEKEYRYILAEDAGDEIHFSFYMIEPVKGMGQQLHIVPFKIIASRDNGFVSKIEVSSLQDTNKRYGIFDSPYHNASVYNVLAGVVQSLNALTRYNDVEFKSKWVERNAPSRTGRGLPGRQKMFRYLQMTDPAELAIVRYVPIDGSGVRASPVLHWRKGHPRRQYNDRRQVVSLSIIPPAIVGSEMNGSLKRGVDMRTLKP